MGALSPLPLSYALLPTVKPEPEPVVSVVAVALTLAAIFFAAVGFCNNREGKYALGCTSSVTPPLHTAPYSPLQTSPPSMMAGLRTRLRRAVWAGSSPLPMMECPEGTQGVKVVGSGKPQCAQVLVPSVPSYLHHFSNNAFW